MEKEVRVPQQKRSIEKKKKIVVVAQQLFNEKGYYGTNASEIAKQAGLSVCSVYSYFKDKKDIFLACLKENGQRINERICEEISELSDSKDIYETAKKVYLVFITAHDFTNKYHNDAMSLKYIDEDVRMYFVNERQFFAETTIEQLKKVGITFKHEKEQTFLIYSLLESLEDEMIYNANTEMDKNIVVNECARIIANMLKNE
jgi:AcrR family transcriptional regulator